MRVSERLKQLKAKGRKGFTLPELLIVLVIVSILLAIAIPKLSGGKTGAIIASMKTDVRNAVAAEETYYSVAQAYKDATLNGGNSGAEAALDPNYPTIKITASPHNTVKITTDTDGDGNPCFTVTVSNDQYTSQSAVYDGCSNNPSIQLVSN